MPDRFTFTSGPPPPARRSGLLTVLILVALAVGAFVQARLLYPLLFLPRQFDAERDADVNLPARMVRVLASDGDLRLLLKTPFDDAKADLLDQERLDGSLFPGAGPHSWYLLVARAEGVGVKTFDLAAEPLLLEGPDGKTWAPLDLPGAVRERGSSLPAFEEQSLRMLVPAPGPLTLESGETRRVLLAYPAEAAPAVVRAARLGERRLAPVTVRKDDLDREIVDGTLAARRP